MQRETDPLLGSKEKDEKTHKKRKRPSLTKAIIKMFACNFLTAIVFKLIQDCLIFVQPQLLRLVLRPYSSLTLFYQKLIRVETCNERSQLPNIQC